jgi:protein TonB
MPEFPGGDIALLKFVKDNVIYPAEAQNVNLQGKVIIKFAVKSNGSVDRIEVLRGIDPSLDNEAIRVVKKLPKFKPGRQNGVAVPVWFMLPVTFRLENN